MTCFWEDGVNESSSILVDINFFVIDGMSVNSRFSIIALSLLIDFHPKYIYNVDLGKNIYIYFFQYYCVYCLQLDVSFIRTSASVVYYAIDQYSFDGKNI